MTSSDIEEQHFPYSSVSDSEMLLRESCSVLMFSTHLTFTSAQCLTFFCFIDRSRFVFGICW